MTHDSLDNLLQQWAARHVPDEAHAQRLAGQVAEALQRPGEPAAELPSVVRESIPLRRRLSQAVAVAAALLLVATVAILCVQSRSAGNNGEAGIPPVAWVGQSELAAETQLFRETERLFGDELRWISENHNEVHMEIRRTLGWSVPEATPLLIRVVVMEKTKRGRGWRPLLTRNFLTRNEELIELTLDPKTEGRLALWGYALPDGKIAVDASIRLPAPIRADVDVTSILDPGKPKKVFSLRTEDNEYRVYEMATPLRPGNDAPCSTT